jgi:hypothetical protein
MTSTQRGLSRVVSPHKEARSRIDQKGVLNMLWAISLILPPKNYYPIIFFI